MLESVSLYKTLAYRALESRRCPIVLSVIALLRATDAISPWEPPWAACMTAIRITASLAGYKHSVAPLGPCLGRTAAATVFSIATASTTNFYRLSLANNGSPWSSYSTYHCRDSPSCSR
ncbi:hypothetical protein GGR57DRAFT_112816 [Xylariaceae sp. FL1272]|nr:hypothetical protein GGR57DRAFT_112816 [Xylariaceae sp. FL1272]